MFVILEDGISSVRQGDHVRNDPGGPNSLAEVRERHEGAVVLAAEVCPGECIFIEADEYDG